MEVEDHEEQEDEEMELPTPTSYDAMGNSSRAKILGGENTAASLRKPRSRYRECLKNHAVGIGGHAVDGCGEFMPAGEEGSLDALKCAACGCHRNFHRKVAEGGAAGEGFYHHQQQPYHPQLSPFYRTPYLHMARPLALPSTSGGGAHSRGDEQEDVSNNPSPSGGGSGSAARKRFRTKFSQEQKDMMLAFAERVGWRIQRQDEDAVQQFCRDAEVKRHVLKVWMHNNKNTLGRKANPNPFPDHMQDENPNPNQPPCSPTLPRSDQA